MADPLRGLGQVTPATRLKAAEVVAAAGAAGITLDIVWGYNPASRPEHSSGRAVDFMVGFDTKSKTDGDWIADYVWRHRNRLGVKHIIWWQRIISTVVRTGVWRSMADRGNATVNHKDHPHVWFLSDAYTAPSASAPPQSPPSATVPAPDQQTNGRLSVLIGTVHVQRALIRLGYDVGRWGADGIRGPDTSAAVRRFQADHGLVPDGIAGRRTMTALWQKLIGARVDGIWGPETGRLTEAFQRRHGLVVDRIAGPASWAAGVA